VWVAISDRPRLLVGISFYSPCNNLNQQRWINLLLDLQNQLNVEREGTTRVNTQQVMSAYSLVPRHPSHWTLARMAKSLSFHIWSYAKILIRRAMRRSFLQPALPARGVLNKTPTVWLVRARPDKTSYPEMRTAGYPHQKVHWQV